MINWRDNLFSHILQFLRLLVATLGISGILLSSSCVSSDSSREFTNELSVDFSSTPDSLLPIMLPQKERLKQCANELMRIGTEEFNVQRYADVLFQYRDSRL